MSSTSTPTPARLGRTAGRRRRAFVLLGDDEYVLLDDAAGRETRTADQQATHIVRSWLRERGRGDEGEDDARAG